MSLTEWKASYTAHLAATATKAADCAADAREELGEGYGRVHAGACQLVRFLWSRVQPQYHSYTDKTGSPVCLNADRTSDCLHLGWPDWGPATLNPIESESLGFGLLPPVTVFCNRLPGLERGDATLAE